jgi:hypothetical protein
LHAPLGAAPAHDVVPVLACVATVLVAPAVTIEGVPATWVVALTAIPVVALMTFAGRRRGVDQPSSSPGAGD